jgi:hypothetical protein|tara:strand:+ start:448 stop:693 length:246 start_codon:yes stop_codon:yes gene_type:complete
MYIVLHKKGNKMTGSFLIGTVKVYSTLVLLSFPTIEECTEAHNEIYDDGTKCFVTYKRIYEKVSVPMARPDNLGEFPIEDR